MFGYQKVGHNRYNDISGFISQNNFNSNIFLDLRIYFTDDIIEHASRNNWQPHKGNEMSKINNLVLINNIAELMGHPPISEKLMDAAIRNGIRTV